MKKLELTPLDEALLISNQAYFAHGAMSKNHRGYSDIDLGVIRQAPDLFVLRVITKPYREEPITEYYGGTREELDTKLTEIGCPPTKAGWRTEDPW